MTRAFMLQGTGSDVGKTVLVAGLCRLASNRGLRVKPFKPQNMSNNAAVSEDGGEIGRAQWLQARAARTATSVHLNPVLLKPQSQIGSQIVVQGQVTGQAKGRDYQKLKPKLLHAVMDSWSEVSRDADLVIVEGAGSPAEINLRRGDIANMGFATQAQIPVVLVGDIDRGGVIASLVGTYKVLSDQDRDMIAGYIINKFRGDISLFDDGLKIVAEHTGWPNFGVLPWLSDAGRLPAEDSVALDHLPKKTLAGHTTFKIVVPVLDRIANFDDFDPLASHPGVELVMIRNGQPFPKDVDLIILPGSKSTMSDLIRFCEFGWDRQLQTHIAKGGAVLGICGGYQILGKKIEDPDGIEGSIESVAGLGHLDIATRLESEKIVRLTEAKSARFNLHIEGYEIHMGRSQGDDRMRPFSFVDGQAEGAVSQNGRVMGTYLHGLFVQDDFRQMFLESLGFRGPSYRYETELDDALNNIAEQLEKHLNVDALFAL